MKIQLQTKHLQEKLAFLNHAVSNKNPLPILLNILLQTRDDKLYLSATDLEIGIETFVPVRIEKAGSVTVPAKTFSELVQSLPDDEITLELTGAVLEVISKRTKSVFQTMNSDEFPKLYEEKGTVLATLNQEDLKKDFTSVVFAASVDTSRPALSGVLVKQEAQGYLLVATDGYRLSLKHHAVTAHEPVSVQEEGASLIIPARAFREVLAIKDADKVVLFIARDKNQVTFQMNETVLIGRLIEAEFPNYEKIIPSDYSSKIQFDREELLKAVKICSIFARDAANVIKCSLRENRLIVSSQTPAIGENSVEVEAVLTGEENEIAFNARYLLDVLSHVGSERMELEMTGPLNPGVFKIAADTSYLHLIMPIRMQQ
jgi:DNA polymerase III subunit beta